MNVLGVPVGWAGGTGLTSIDQVRSEARYAVDANFDSFWVSQIFGVDPIVALAAIASEVKPLSEVGTSVVPLYGRHPLALAAQARTAQSALGGRFTLGIGPSHQMVVEGFFGESYRRPATRTAEFVEAIAPLLRGEQTNVDGDELTSHGWLTIDSEPVPLLLAAMGPRMLDLAGRRTAGTSLGLAVGPTTIARHIVPIISEAAADAGNPSPRVKALVGIAVTDDPESAYQHSVTQSTMYADLPAYRAMLDREGVQTPADLLIAGTEDEVTDGLLRYVDAGATELRIGVSSFDDATEHRSRDYLADLLRA
jgi:5,10-methylenetetrahydromethanopterin reductase